MPMTAWCRSPAGAGQLCLCLGRGRRRSAADQTPKL